MNGLLIGTVFIILIALLAARAMTLERTLIIVVAVGLAGTANAELIDRGIGMIYDDGWAARSGDVPAIGVGSAEFIWHSIDTSYHHDPFDVRPIDMDQDGDMDFVSGATYFGNGALSWWENDGNEIFTEHFISGAGNFWVAWPIDMNNDGAVDILTERDWENTDFRITLWLNDGAENFSPNDLLSLPDRPVCSRRVAIADVDSDDDVDILCADASIGRVLTWYENRGNLDFVQHVVGGQPYNAVWAADLDDDLDTDLISDFLFTDTEPGNLTWWENDGEETFTPHVVATFDSAFFVTDVDTADVDGDEDLDLLVTIRIDRSVAGEVLWFENEAGVFSEHVIDGNMREASSVTAADFDGDDDMDIVAAEYFGDSVRWYENDGSGQFTRYTLSSNIRGANAIRPIDLDGDDDTDILGQAFFQRDIVWWENIDIDLDDDGISDNADNCTEVANPDQRDSNNDGLGNACDTDLNNDCLVNFIDLSYFSAVFGTGYANADFDGNGTVDFGDLAFMRQQFFGPPGPSGVSNFCAAT